MRFKMKINQLNLSLSLQLILCLVLICQIVEISGKKVNKRTQVTNTTKHKQQSQGTLKRPVFKGSTSILSKSTSKSSTSSKSSKSSSSGSKSHRRVKPTVGIGSVSKNGGGLNTSTSSGSSSSTSSGSSSSTSLPKYVNITKYSRLKANSGTSSSSSSSNSKPINRPGTVSNVNVDQLRKRESFGLSMSHSPDLGIKESNWVGIEKGQMERGGLHSDGLDMEFSKVYMEPSTNKVLLSIHELTTPNSIPSSVEHGMLVESGHGQSSIELLDKRFAEMEKMMQTIVKNIEVMQQNTQVISKGFNILSGRVNKVSADHEDLHARLLQNKLHLEEKVQDMYKNSSKRVMELELKNNQEIDNLKKTDQDLLESQITAGQELKSSMDSMDNQLGSWKSEADSETKTLAEMVKALAEISKTEKLKLEQLTNKSEGEFKRFDESFRKCQVEDANNREAFATKIRVLREEVQENLKTSNDTKETLKSALGSLSKHVEDQLRRIDTAILEQNMAHNMAHENIVLKLEEFDNSHLQGSSLLSSSASAEDFLTLITRLENTEMNVTTLFNANKQFLTQVADLEDTDLAILSKISDLRNMHRHDNSTTRNDVLVNGQKVSSLMSDLMSIGKRMQTLEKRFETDKSMEIGGLSMSDPTLPTLRTTEGGQLNDLDLGEIRDRFGTIEENVAELWRSQKDLKGQHENFASLITDLQTSHLRDNEDSSLQIMEVKIATKMITEVIRNTTRSVMDIEKRIESIPQNLGTSSRAIGPNKEEIEKLRDEMQTTRENIASLWESSKNVSKAQEFFLFKLLEMDLEHKQDNMTVSKNIMKVHNRTEDFLMQISRSDELINKLVQQFDITDAEQVKVREELLDIKDRMATTEENYKNLWKSSKKIGLQLEEIENNVENIILIHKSEHKDISQELAANTDKVGNLTKNVDSLNERVSNIELVMDLEVSGESHSSELGKLKARISNSEKDVSELWKSTEILSFQQQAFSENFKTLKNVHENDTSMAKMERTKTGFETLNLFELFGNLTNRVSKVEKCTNPPYESKTIDLDIPNWRALLSGGLKDRHVIYDLGKLVDVPTSWKGFVELNGNHLSIFNTLLKSDRPVYNEISADILDSDGKTFATYGPDVHLYTANNEKIGWSNVISLQTLENPSNRLLTKDALKIRFRVKVYPKVEKEQPQEEGPSEKQLIQWEVRDLLEKIKGQQVEDHQAFLDLNITKEFGAGHIWEGHTLWRSSLLVREINNQNYLGINMELIQNDGNWKELVASYNVTLLDSHSRIFKEFSIAANDFKSVSARHSYFMLVKDVEEVLKRGDLITIKIYFDLKAKRRSFDVEVIR